MLVLEVSTDIGFCMLFKGLGPMVEVRLFLVLHENCGVSTAIYHIDSILVRLSTFCQESLEFGLRNIVPWHNIIEVLSKYHLSNIIL